METHIHWINHSVWTTEAVDEDNYVTLIK